MPESPRWNPDTQSWETGPPRPVRPYTGPMPPRPAAPPPAGAVGPDPAGPAAPAYPPEPPHAPGADDVAGASVPAGATSHRTRVLIAAAATAVVAAGAGGAYLLWGRGPDAPPAGRPTAAASSGPTAVPTGTGASTATPTADPSATATVPEGYRLVHDDKGFTLAVPDGWRRDVRSTGVFYTSPDTRSLLQVFQITEPDLTPRQALEQASQGLSGNPGYQELGIAPRRGPGGTDGAVLTYAYDSDRLGLRVQAVDCAFTVPDGRQFAVLVLGPESDWPQQETIQRIALESFGPSA
ncbi:hypothetical protein ACFIN9_15570 [Streptomyces noursei]|uniref:hypothetical protein n=1 Tax=Streptomyces noursei TaxID=1971 RepID=UPI003627AB7E